MAAVKIELHRAEDQRDVVHRAVQALSEGKIVALPTETVYGLACNALNPAAVKRLIAIKGRPEDKPFSIAIKSLEDAYDFVPDMPRLAERLGRRCWPGPVTLVLNAQHKDSVIHRLEENVRQSTVPNGTVGLRVPAHEVTQQIMRLSVGPLVLTSANISGEPDAVSADQIPKSLEDQIDLIVDDGQTKFAQPSTVVQVDGTGLNVLREGILDEQTIRKLTNFIALVVCTGNTCRSPMGEGLFRKRLAEKLGCAPNELEEHGVSVLSAGIAAMPGSPATTHAVDAMRNLGIDISDHSSQPITGRLAQFADLILTMTNGHRQALVSHWPSLESRTKTLRRDGADVSDPIGSPANVYIATANQIDENLAQWIDELEI